MNVGNVAVPGIFSVSASKTPVKDAGRLDMQVQIAYITGKSVSFDAWKMWKIHGQVRTIPVWETLTTNLETM